MIWEKTLKLMSEGEAGRGSAASKAAPEQRSVYWSRFFDKETKEEESCLKK